MMHKEFGSSPSSLLSSLALHISIQARSHSQRTAPFLAIVLSYRVVGHRDHVDLPGMIEFVAGFRVDTDGIFKYAILLAFAHFTGSHLHIIFRAFVVNHQC